MKLLLVIMERISFVLAAFVSFAAAVGMLSFDIVIYSRGGCAGHRSFRIPWASRVFLLVSQGLTLFCISDKFSAGIPAMEMFAAAGIALLPSGEEAGSRFWTCAGRVLCAAAFILLPFTFFVQSGHSSFPVASLWTVLSSLLLLAAAAGSLSAISVKRGSFMRRKAVCAALLLTAGMMLPQPGHGTGAWLAAYVLSLACILASAVSGYGNRTDNVVHEEVASEQESVPQATGYCVQEGLRERFEEYFEKQKPYLNPELSINDVARSLCSNKTYISRMLNGQMGQNFNQVVNGYRIRYAMEHFRNNPSIRVFDLADASGFKSLSTFSLAFRMHVGEAPGDWCRKTRARILKEQKLRKKSPLVIEE